MTRSMVVAAQPEAAEAGIGALQAGGNAVDAAITSALVQCVVDPMMCGIAGFGDMQIYMPNSSAHVCIEFYAQAPSRVAPDMWASLFRGPNKSGLGYTVDGYVNDVGYQSIAIPASLAAFHEAHRRFGDLYWAQIVAPAIRYAEDGFVVRRHMAYWWNLKDPLRQLVDNDVRLRTSPGSSRLYCRTDGTPKSLGERIYNPDLAATLREIARDGADCFYRGRIAEVIARDMELNGGMVTYDDLSSYRPRISTPVWIEYRGHRIAVNNPPGAGVVLAETLSILNNLELSRLRHNSPDYIQLVVEALKAAIHDKEIHMADPDVSEVPVGHMLDPAYGRELAGRIKTGDFAELKNSRTPVSADTTQVCVHDANGNAVSLTHSLGLPSGVVTEGLGIMHNGGMSCFDPRPGRPNSIAPRRRRYSGMCPAIAFSRNTPSLVIGSPGGAHIVPGVLQTLLNTTDFEMPILDAVIAPRFSVTGNAINVSNRIPRSVTAVLEKRGYAVSRSPHSYDFGAVHAIAIKSGRCAGAADPAYDGVALVADD